MALADMAEIYLTAAEDVYRHIPEAQSMKILTVMELWVACDLYATNFYPALREYHTGFRPGMFNFLILPRKEDLTRLAALEYHLNKRQKDAKMGVPWEFVEGSTQPNSFAVRYYESCSELKTLHDRLRKAAESAKAAKEAEYGKLKDKFDARIREVNRAPPCHHDWYWSDCSICEERDTARRMSIQVFEEPLPDDELVAKTLVFELQLPEVYARWRDLTLRILTATTHPDPTANQPSQREPYLTQKHPVVANTLGPQGGARGFRFRPASTSVPSKSSHGTSILVSEAKEKIFTPHGYVYELYDTLTRKPIVPSQLLGQLHAGFAYPPPTTHEALRQYIVGTSHSENDVTAATTSSPELPSNMSRDEFKIFGTLRAGDLLQWRNILEQLLAPTLDFNKVDTLYLVLQTANEAGPSVGDGPLRQSHAILDDETFGLRLIDALEDAFARVSKNWDNHVSWCIYLSLATRLFSMSTRNTVRIHCLSFLSEIRHRAISCVRDLRKSIEESDSVQGRKNLSKQALLLALICHVTFDIGNALPVVLADVKEASILVAASIFIAELTAGEVPRDVSEIEVDPVMNLLLYRWRRLSYTAEDFLRGTIAHKPGIHTCLDIAVTEIWAEYAPPTEWTIAEEDDYRHVLSAAGKIEDERTSMHEFQYNLLTGQFLMDHMPISSLPQEYLIDDTYRRLFGERVIKVFPKKLEKTVFSAEKPQFEHFPIHFGKGDDGLIIRAEKGGQMYEFIPPRKLEGDFPPLLVSDYIHWWVEDKNTVEFRPLKKAWEPIGEAGGRHGFVLHLGVDDASPAQLKRNASTCLVGSRSKTWSTVTSIFQSIELPKFIHLMLIQDGHGTGCLEIELPRYGMRFSLLPGDTSITSNHYRGFSVDGSQSFGALVGLQSKLVLKFKASGLRAVVVPHGKLCFAKEQSGHASSWVHTGDRRPIKHHFLQIDTTLGQLNDGGALGNKLFLVYLHAITSHCLPDPLTGRTGTEEALRILNTAAVKSFDRLRKGPESLLRQIAGLSPRRFLTVLADGRVATAIWSQLSMLAQDDAFYVSVQAILNHARRCQFFFREKHKGGKVEIEKLGTSQDELVRRSLNRAATFRVAQFGAEEFTTSHDEDYKARDENTGSPAGLRSYSVANLLANTRSDAAQRTEEIPDSTFEALALALRCRIEGSKEELEDYPRDEDQGPGYVPTQQFGRDFNVRWLDRLSSTLRHSWFDILAWVRDSNLDEAGEHFHDRYRLTMFFAALSFAEETDAGIIQLLLTFAMSHAVRNLPVPVQESELRLTDGAVTEVKRLTQLIKKHAWGQNVWRWRFEPDKSAAVTDLVNALSRQDPCDNIDEPADASRYRKYLPLDAIMADVRDLFSSWSRNGKYMAYLRNAIDKARSLKQQEIEVEETRRTITIAGAQQGDDRRRSVSVDDLFAQNPPEISPLQPEQFEAYILRSKHDDNTTELRVSRLRKILSEDCQDGPEHRSKYVERLQHSIDEFTNQSVRLPSRPSLDGFLKDDFKERTAGHLADCQVAVEKMRTDITHTLKQSPNAAGRGAFLGPLQPRITTILLLEHLTPRRHRPTSPEWKQAIMSFAYSIRVLQRAERLARAAGLPADLARDEVLRELNDTASMKLEGVQPKDPDWDRMKHPESLLLEVENGIFIRPVQESIARHMLQGYTVQPRDLGHAVMQLNMGEGKSSVIIPIVAAALADSALVRVVVTKPQFGLMMQILAHKLGRLLNRRIYTLPVSRKLKLDKEGANVLVDLCDECKRNGGILLLQVDHILSLRLLGLEAIIKNSDGTTGSTILEGLSQLEDHSRDIIDEADEVFNPRYELTYAMGTQQNLNFGRQRWQLIQDVLSVLAKAAERLHKNGQRGLEFDEREGLHRAFPKTRITQNSTALVLAKAVAEEICIEGLEGLSKVALHSDRTLSQTLLEYITKADPDQSIVKEMERGFMSKTTRPYALLLRGLLALGVLGFVLQKRWTVNYGLSEERRPRTGVAVPYVAKDWPSPRSEFSHPDVVILCTCLSYYYRGLTDGELMEAFRYLRNRSDGGSSEYSAWIKDNKNIPVELRHLTSINLKDNKQCANGIFNHLRFTKRVIDYYLSNILFARQMREFPEKLSASPWDLTGRRKHLLTGFSGTNDSRDMLPLPVRYLDLQPYTNAAVLDCLLRPENTVRRIDMTTKGKQSAAEFILDQLSKSSPEIRVILDVGAQLLDMNNLEVANAWLHKADTAEAVIVFDGKGNLVVVTKDGRTEAFLASPYSMHTSACLVFLDEAHTRGTDLKLPPHYRASVTLGPNVTKDKLVQGTYKASFFPFSKYRPHQILTKAAVKRA